MRLKYIIQQQVLVKFSLMMKTTKLPPIATILLNIFALSNM